MARKKKGRTVRHTVVVKVVTNRRHKRTKRRTGRRNKRRSLFG